MSDRGKEKVQTTYILTFTARWIRQPNWDANKVCSVKERVQSDRHDIFEFDNAHTLTLSQLLKFSTNAPTHSSNKTNPEAEVSCSVRYLSLQTYFQVHAVRIVLWFFSTFGFGIEIGLDWGIHLTIA